MGHENTANNNQTLFTPARNGDWAVNLESFIGIDDANAYATKLEKRDIYTDIKTVNIKGKLWYRVRIIGFSSKQDAEKQRQLLTKTLHLNSAWISKSSVTTGMSDESKDCGMRRVSMSVLGLNSG